ncbi:TIGR02391 family protein [Streptomyces cinereoruber]|uniref:TIGR02391 family protein n=1 Tax=Streptomyces cinereoruber TaxID=67260 RepID=UPI003C3041A0
MEDDGGDAFHSIHRGAMAFAEGCYAGIRNPNSHEDGLPELPEHEALEQLAAFSVLARRVDNAEVTKPS